MLHRFQFWVRRTWQKLPLQLSLLGWPPLLSHALAFIIGTLVLQRSDGGWRMPSGKILIPADKLGKLETAGKVWKAPQKLTLLTKNGEAWCRLGEDELSLWKAPGRKAVLYVQWPAGANGAARMQQALQKKAVLTADGQSFAFCGSEPIAAGSSGIIYD